MRFGGGYYDLVSASFKFFMSEPGAVELNLGIRTYGIPGFNWTNVGFSASYQHHFDIGAVEGLRWFVGAGGTVANSFSSYDAYSGFQAGVFPTGGVEYTFKFPLVVSADIRPTFYFLDPYDYDSYNSFQIGNGGLSARYIF